MEMAETARVLFLQVVVAYGAALSASCRVQNGEGNNRGEVRWK